MSNSMFNLSLLHNNQSLVSTLTYSAPEYVILKLQ